MNYLTFKDCDNIIITQHARERALQRAKLFLYSHEKDNLKTFLKEDFINNARIDIKVINCPFYQNKQQSEYGTNCFRATSSMFEYRGRFSDDAVIISTVIFIRRIKHA